MSTQSIYAKDVSTTIDSLDRHVACVSDEYMKFHRYKVGRKIDINEELRLIRLRDILAGNCATACLNIRKIIEKINL